tara:strand:+ start:833 stop:1240 length:408 start_codon:yes stop_codon:yes gene_type:complete
MGNRAVIGFEDINGDRDMSSVGIYLHWNGGRDSVESFLKAAKGYGVRGGDSAYCIARLTQIIANFFGGTLSVGVDQIKNLDYDNYDNGLYWVNSNFEIVGREYQRRQEQNEYNLFECLSLLKEKNDEHFFEDSLR